MTDEFEIVTDHAKTKGVGQVTKISAMRAWTEGTGICLLIWLITLPTALVPIVHLVSVPAGIFGGIAISIFVSKKKSGRVDLESGKGPCPSCGLILNTFFRDIGGNRAGSTCPDCRTSYTIKYKQKL